MKIPGRTASDPEDLGQIPTLTKLHVKVMLSYRPFDNMPASALNMS